MSALTQIQLIRQQTLDRIVEITAAPKPTYDVGGQEVQWAEYLEQLQRTVDWCDGQEAAADPDNFGPAFTLSTGRT